MKKNPTNPREEFPEKVKITTKTPFGYYKNPKDPKEGLADYPKLKILQEAFNRKDAGDSHADVQDFFEDNGVSLSPSGFTKLHVKYRGYQPRSSAKKSAKAKSNRKYYKKKKAELEREKKKQEEAERKRKLQIAAEKRKITYTQKRLDKLQNPEGTEQTPYGESSFSVPDIQSEDGRPVVFNPNPGPQTDFLAAPELEVLFGGAAGGGKSYALIADPIRYFDNKNFVGLLLRRTNDELRELIWKTKELYPQIYPGAKFSEKASEWRFPSGARMWMSYLDRDDDVLRYQGQAYSWIGFDELTHWPTPYPLDYLRSRLRTAKGSGLENSLGIRATTNPGGPGHSWVKKMFIDPAPAGKPFWAKDIETGEDLLNPSTGEPLFKRRFIPSTLYDNPYLAEDGAYEANLASLPEKRRKQLLLGDWSVADGAAFEEFNPSVHVIEPFEIDKNWTRFRAMDYGYAAPSACLWFAIDPQDEQLICYREMYVNKMTGEALADTILQLEQGERIHYGMLDSSVWHKRGEGPSVAEVMIARGCRWRQSDRSAGSRVAGKNRIHELLKVDKETGRPGLVFFNTCRQVISDLPVIPSDPKGTEDIDPRYPSDHTYDALRYGVMSRPKSDPYAYTPQYKQVQVSVDQTFGY